MTPFRGSRTAPNHGVFHRQPIGPTSRRILVASAVSLATLASCGGDDDATNSAPTSTVATSTVPPASDRTTEEGTSTPDHSVAVTSDDGEADGLLPGACDVIDL